MGKTEEVKSKEVKRAFELSLGIEEIFKNGSVSEKKGLLSEIQSNLTIKDKKVSVCNVKIISIIIKGLLAARSHNPSFEPEFYQADKRLTETFTSVSPTLLRR
ncbi:hypothetical protein L0Y69_02870 [bacterium]|nr:hypothetical protein [bacterium]